MTTPKRYRAAKAAIASLGIMSLLIPNAAFAAEGTPDVTDISLQATNEWDMFAPNFLPFEGKTTQGEITAKWPTILDDSTLTIASSDSGAKWTGGAGTPWTAERHVSNERWGDGDNDDPNDVKKGSLIGKNRADGAVKSPAPGAEEYITLTWTKPTLNPILSFMTGFGQENGGDDGKGNVLWETNTWNDFEIVEINGRPASDFEVKQTFKMQPYNEGFKPQADPNHATRYEFDWENIYKVGWHETNPEFAGRNPQFRKDNSTNEKPENHVANGGGTNIVAPQISGWVKSVKVKTWIMAYAIDGSELGTDIVRHVAKPKMYVGAGTPLDDPRLEKKVIQGAEFLDEGEAQTGEKVQWRVRIGNQHNFSLPFKDWTPGYAYVITDKLPAGIKADSVKVVKVPEDANGNYDVTVENGDITVKAYSKDVVINEVDGKYEFVKKPGLDDNVAARGLLEAASGGQVDEWHEYIFEGEILPGFVGKDIVNEAVVHPTMIGDDPSNNTDNAKVRVPEPPKPNRPEGKEPVKAMAVKSNGSATPNEVEVTVSNVLPTLEVGAHYDYFTIMDPMPVEMEAAAPSAEHYRVKIDDVALTYGDDFTVTYEGNMVAANFTRSGLDKISGSAGKTVSLAFDAQVLVWPTSAGNGKLENTGYVAYDVTAVPGDPSVPPFTPPANPGEPPVVPPNTPDVPPALVTNTIESTWGKIKINKIDAKSKAGLAGAKFEVYAGQAGAAECVAAVEGEPVSVNGLTEFMTDVDGVVTINALHIDTAAKGMVKTERCYTLKEIAAPAGYKLPEGDEALTAVKLTNTVEAGVEVNIENKVAVPPLDENPVKAMVTKQNGSATADAVEITVSAKVPNLPVGDFDFFTIMDPMPVELEAQAPSADHYRVMLDGAELTYGDDFTVTYEGNMVTAAFTRVGLDKLKGGAGKEVALAFDAQVKQWPTSAGAGKLENTGYVAYDVTTVPGDPSVPPYTPPTTPGEPPVVPPNTPDVPPVTPTNTIESTWGKIKINKVDVESKAGLAGAKFEVYAGQAGAAECVAAVEGEPVSVNGMTEFTADADGVVTIDAVHIDTAAKGMAKTERCYTLKETAAPAGYKLPAGDEALTAVKVVATADAEGFTAVTIDNTPDTPENPPTDPNKPGEPGNPGNPPTDPNKPGEPGNPGNPPTDPNKPGEPGNPGNPPSTVPPTGKNPGNLAVTGATGMATFAAMALAGLGVAAMRTRRRHG